MAMRKYKTPLSPAANAQPADNTPQGPEQRPLDAPASPAQQQEQVTATPQATPADDGAMSLKAQLEQMRQGKDQRDAEAERIKAMASTPLEQQLEQIPGLSVMQRAYLRERPHALTRTDLLQAAHNFSLAN